MHQNKLMHMGSLMHQSSSMHQSSLMHHSSPKRQGSITHQSSPMQKNRYNSGETLIESLVAVLIITLSSVMLIMSISTATKLNLKAASYEGRFDWEYNYANKTIAKKDGYTLTGQLDPGSVVLDIDGNKVYQDVIWCGGEHIGSYIPGKTN